MENRAYALIVGTITLLLGIGLAAALWWMTSGGGNTTEYIIESPRSVSGINRQAVVRFRGIRVGKVSKIELDRARAGHVLIHVEVMDDTPITRATRAKVGFQGISGMGHIQLDDDGSDPQPLERPAGQPPRIALQSNMVDQLTQSGQDIVAKLQTTTDRLNQVLSPENVDRITRSLDNLARSSAHVERTLAQTPALIADLRRFSSAQNAEQLQATLTNLRQLSQQLPQAIESWNRALGRVEAAGGRIDRLGGELQQNLSSETLPRVNDLVEDLQTTSTRLNSLIEELERSPQMLVVGREATRPGPGEGATR
ncbi:MlaD family protein [Uliginosibacterium sp. H1]|uniref:MlaD family protein n=1 Tax=Uliginosibacterium sp. H1 TaxID=3114757 RepID=UPI002E18604F|nr:MlaD family protein [Uliginosibacterium sp. H1]